MKLTNFLISRQDGMSKDIFLDDETIHFQDINASIELKDWTSIETTKFHEFISSYLFPKNEEFSKKDREGIRGNVPSPQIIMQRQDNQNSGNKPIIAMYLYDKKQLTGDSILHIRSINKFEQMWMPYFLNITSFGKDSPKLIKRDFYDYSQSDFINFTYNLTDDQNTNTSRLRILCFGFGNFVLMAYVFDNSENELTQEDLNSIIDTIKSSA